ncbi:MAG TPA: ATP-binding protein [Bacteroidota bacterium]|nr:ATP-binding protein [Bacteroidota bacterium]
MPTIGSKLGVGIGTMVLLCIAIGLVSYMQSRDVSDKIREITDVREPVNSAVHAMETSLEESALATLGYLSAGDTSFLALFQASRGEFEEAIRSYGAAGGNDAGVRLREGFLQFCALATEQIELRNAQSRNMSALLATVDQIEGLLKGKIVPSIKADDPIAYRREQAALQMEVNANAMTKSLGTFIITGDPAYEVRLHHAEEEFQKYFAVYSNVLISSEEKGWKERLAGLADEAMSLAQAVADQHKARTRKMSAFTVAYRDLEAVLSERLGIRTAQGLSEAKEEVLATEAAANTRIFIAVIICVGVGLLGGALTTRSITSPIRELAAVMDRVAKGGYLHRAHIRSTDEIRALGESFNMMTVQLEQAERQRSAGLRAYAISVQRAQEDERERIARELHDDISQRLTGMKFRVEVLADEAEPSNRRLVRGLREVNQELDRAITEVQRISSNLRPSVLDDFGLVTALRMLCKEFEKMHGVATTFRVASPPPSSVDGNLEIALYRIAQEALANTAKHAHARTAALTLESDAGGVTLTVSDDGAGFSDADATRARAEGHGMGLMSMRERSELLGGTFRADSAAGTGTTITVTIPLSVETTNEESQDTHRG